MIRPEGEKTVVDKGRELAQFRDFALSVEQNLRGHSDFGIHFEKMRSAHNQRYNFFFRKDTPGAILAAAHEYVSGLAEKSELGLAGHTKVGRGDVRAMGMSPGIGTGYDTTGVHIKLRREWRPMVNGG